MRFGKKVITWLMALTMVFGLLPAQVMADTTPSVTLQLQDTGNFLADDDVSVDVVFTAGNEAVTLSAFEFYIQYDNSLLGIAQNTFNKDNPFTYNSNSVISTWSNSTSISSVADTTIGLISMTGTIQDNNSDVVVYADTSLTMGTLNFVALDDVVGESAVSFITDFVAAGLDTTKANIVTKSDNSNVENVDFSSSVTVNVVEPGIVLSTDEVTVDGTNAEEITAKVYDADGTQIKTGSFSFGSTDSSSGAQYISFSNVDADGVWTITVAEKTPAADYTISYSGYTATITVNRATSVATSIDWLATSTDATSYTIPGIGASASGGYYGVSVKDQFGDTMENPTVDWSIVLKDGGTTVEGVSVSASGDYGISLDITSDAATTITDTTGETFTLTAKYSDTLSVTKEITIKRATSELTSLGILKDGTPITSDTIAIPTGDDDTEVTYTAVGYDQYGSEMTGVTPVLSFTDSVTGVTATDSTGVVSVPSTANTGTITLTATQSSLADPMTTSITISIVDIAFTNVDTSDFTVNSATYGMKWSEIVSAFNTNNDWVAKVGDDVIEGTYRLQNANTIPSAGSQTYTIVFNGGDYTNVTAATGTVSIGNATITDTTTTTQSATYTGSAISITAPTATTVNGQTATMAYTDSSDSTSYTEVGTYTIEYKITAPNHEDATGTITFTISKEGSTTTTTPSDSTGTTGTSYTYGDTITLTAEVALDTSAGTASVSAVDDPTVEFFAGTTSLGTAAVTSDGSATTGVGTATLVYDTYDQDLAIGNNTIKAVYGGSVNLNESESSEITVKLVAKSLTDTTMTVSINTADESYTGSAITKVITVEDSTIEDSTTTLTLGTDYTVAYEDNTNVGTATVTVTGDGYYTGSVVETFTIDQENSVVTTPDGYETTISATYGDTIALQATVGIVDTSARYSSVASISSVETPAQDTVSFYYGEKLLGSVADVEEGATVTYDYDTYKNDLSISENNAIDVYYGGSGNLIGASSVGAITVSLSAKSLTSEDISVSGIDAAGYDYIGSAITPTITVTDGANGANGTALTLETDYTVVYSDNTSAGTATITITGSGNYTGTITEDFTINKATATVTPGGDDATTGDGTGEVVADFTETYGENITLSVTIGVAGVATLSSTDTPKTVYFYCEGTELGTVENVIEGDTASITVSSTKFDIGNNSVDVYYGGSDNLNSGLIATLTVAVEAKSLEHTDITVSGIENKDYTGSAITQDGLTVKDGASITLVKDVDYEVEYDDNINAGQAKVTITGIGNYKDSVTENIYNQSNCLCRYNRTNK